MVEQIFISISPASLRHLADNIEKELIENKLKLGKYCSSFIDHSDMMVPLINDEYYDDKGVKKPCIDTWRFKEIW